MLRWRLQHTSAWVAAAGFACLIRTAVAQGPIQDRPSERPLDQPGFLPPEEAQPFRLPPLPEPAPPGAPSGPQLYASGFAFEGNKVIPTAELQTVAEPYSGRELSFAELEELRQKLSRHYIDEGYINSGALLPEDFYRDGIVHFRIVEGRLSDVRARGLGRLRESYLRQRLPSFDKPLDINELQERFQLLLTDPLFANVNARLQPGAAPGEAVLDVDVTRARPWDLAVYFNNYQPPSIGAEAIGVTGVVRNLTGFGDALEATFQQGREDTQRYAANWQVPLVYRTDLRVAYDHEESTVLEEPLDVLDLASTLDSYEVGLSHALIDTIRRRLALTLVYTHRENSTTLLGEPFSFVPGEPTGTSKVDAWRFAQDYIQRAERQTFALRSTFTLGHTNVDPDAGPSEFVPAKDYFFWLGQAQYTRLVLPNGASVSLRGTVQLSADRLVPMEKIALGGVASVRGYRENTLVRDQGYYLNFEFRYPVFERSGHRLYVIPFLDYGEAWNKGGERDDLASIGLGFSWQFRGLSAELYYGAKLIDPPVETSGNLQDDGISFQLRYAF